MADSNVTKKALANALKELMNEVPFEKINVAQICEKCNMNRKSFYYHFKDKYDLVNWIFDLEFISILTIENTDVTQKPYQDRWELLDNLCETFYENKTFYRKALKISGQNSFSEHFRECMHPIIKKRLEYILDSNNLNEFSINFFSDACVCAFERWLLEKNCMTPNEFTSLLKNVFQTCAIAIYNDMQNHLL